MLMRCFLLIVLLLRGSLLIGQTIRINEVASSNSTYFDEDGDTPDWIELHNYGSQSISLKDWSISDNLDNLSKWVFPDISLKANEYLLLWASGKDRPSISFSRTLINQGDTFKYLIPTFEPNSNWKNLNFDDSSWQYGNSGFGYNDSDDNTEIPYGTKSVYLRKNFTINNVDDISSIILDVDFDDAFVAYINGKEIARANINGVPPAYNSSTLQDHEAKMYTGGKPDRFSISNFKEFLQEGENVLTIQAHNVSDTSSDFTIIPFLSAVFNKPNSLGVSPPSILELGNGNFHTNFKISSKSETIFLVDHNQKIIDEITADNLPPNTSVGVAVSSGNIVHYTQTTPGSKNSSNEYSGIVQSKVVFSEENGLIDNPINLVLSGNAANEVIRYTIDASEPSESSNIYSSPIIINKNTSVRAQIFSNNTLPSKIYTKTYVLNANHEIDVVSLTTDPRNLFDDDYGIYVFGPNGTFDTQVPHYGANFWEDWEKPVHFTFYENEGNNFDEFNGGLKIFGGWSRGQNEQRSLAIFARGQYGDSQFKHSFFDELTYKEFQSLVLRNSGQDWLKSSMKDIMLTSLMRGSELDFQEHNPVATYINGVYWGMYNLREKINEHMLASKHNIDADAVTLLTNNAEELEGSSQEYQDLISYITNTDLSSNLNFEYVKQHIDLKEYTLYQVANIFFNNTDWPGNNIKFWKHPGGKWRWILYDTDFAFGPFWNTGNYHENTLDFALNPNGPNWPNPAWSTLLFRRLITNIEFKNQFINRYADELNTRFLPDHIKNHIDNVYQKIAPELRSHYQKWGANSSIATFYINQMKNFATNRPAFVKNHIKAKFNLPNIHTITITSVNPSEGLVEVNENLKIQEFSWSGGYFEKVPIQLKAIPEAGFEFSHWSGAISSTNDIITVDMKRAMQITPNFRKSTSEIPLVINEINYKSGTNFKANDWIEIYNPNSFSVDISNWKLKDNDDSHVYTIPTGTSILGNDFLILVKDVSDFSSVYPNVKNFIGEFNFGLGASDSVRLFNSDDILQDVVIYENSWANCADETGKTLELVAADLDNNLPESWDCSNTNGSPNIKNDESLSNGDILAEYFRIYPNPVKQKLFIVSDVEKIKVEIYNAIGQLVLKQKNVKTLDVNLLKKGMYFIKISDKKKRTTLKFVKN